MRDARREPGSMGRVSADMGRYLPGDELEDVARGRIGTYEYVVEAVKRADGTILYDGHIWDSADDQGHYNGGRADTVEGCIEGIKQAIVELEGESKGKGKG